MEWNLFTISKEKLEMLWMAKQICEMTSYDVMFQFLVDNFIFGYLSISFVIKNVWELLLKSKTVVHSYSKDLATEIIIRFFFF